MVASHTKEVHHGLEYRIHGRDGCVGRVERVTVSYGIDTIAPQRNGAHAKSECQARTYHAAELVVSHGKRRVAHEPYGT